jgi:alpha-amylase/alpha-mannosidase (GH57 family)
MTPPRIRLALLWHMHQPYYLDPSTGESILPWVRLHALKDYWGMVATVRGAAGMRVTFNLVPALVEQVEAYAQERTWDRHLVLGLAEAETLPEADAAWFVREAFHAHGPSMIAPYPRYAELAAQALRRAAFTADDVRDLQVWQKLAWVDPDLLAEDPRARRLVGKGRHFDEHDKQALRALELDLLRRVVPAYRAAAASGDVELSTSPYFHPILPLLCDSAAHHAAHPTAPLPDPPFRHPEDAALQLARALAAHERWFGARPSGVWPSEGSVSDLAAAEVARAGFTWMGTDEGILIRSASPAPLHHAAHCQPHALQTPAGEVRVLFRDHGLSDLVGFTYQSWRTEDAVGDFLARVRAAGQEAAAHGIAEPVVPVILDGENAWEHYPGGGRPFLRELYTRLVAAPDITPVTMREAAAGAARRLTSIFAGSWINADFGVWIGHRDDRRAWEELGRARDRYVAAPDAPEDARAAALDAILAAEGSDWCWWYGDDHSSAHDRDFDALFRRHLARVYEALGEAVPEVLHRTLITTDGDAGAALTPGPVDADGPRDSYFAGAGSVSLERPGGAMHRAASGPVADGRVGLTVDGIRVAVALGSGARVRPAVETRRDVGDPPRVWPIDGAVDLTWDALGVGPGEIVRLRVVARDDDGAIVQTMPADGADRLLTVPTGGADGRYWRA